MLSQTCKSVWPFLPAKDFEEATRFYLDMGFTCPRMDDGVRVFRLGDEGFLLQDYYVAEWADNCMMNLHVTDLDAWQAHLRSVDLASKYVGVRVGDPATEDDMLVVHVVDPTGILWHITQWADGRDS